MDFDFDFLSGVESFLLDDHWPLFDQNPAQVSVAIDIISVLDHCLGFNMNLLVVLVLLI